MSANIANLIEPHARACPTAPAIAALGQPELSYQELSRFIGEVGGRLGERGIGPSSRVVLMVSNGPEAATAFLAVAAVATCAPLNPALGVAELEFCLDDLDPSLLIVDARIDNPVRDVARARAIPILELGPTSQPGRFTLSGDSENVTERDADAADMALLLYTSGTTTRPKLVPLRHSNLQASAMAIARSLELSPKDCGLNIMPLFHVHGLVAGILASLAVGARVVCSVRLEPECFGEWLRTAGATWYTAVPTMHDAILSSNDAHALRDARLRFVRSSSSPLAQALLHKMEASFGCPVIEAYGMTEAAHQISSNPLMPGARRPGSVGIPKGTEVAILTPDGANSPPDTEGEIAIRGDNVMFGYLNNPEANRAAFTTGWLRTGDLGRIDLKGYLYLSGRAKELINRGGEKVAPREIDETLLEHPAVADAMAFAVPHQTLGEDVVAAVVPRDRATVDTQELRAFVFERLAGHKVPSQILLVDAIPKSATGKPQRTRLAEWFADALKPTMVAPRSRLETVLVAIYEKVLGREVGVLDNFFALGGDSLKGAQLIQLVRAVIGADLPLVAAFRHPTVAELAQSFEQNGPDQPRASELAQIELLTEAEARELVSLIIELSRMSGARLAEVMATVGRPEQGQQ